MGLYGMAMPEFLERQDTTRRTSTLPLGSHQFKKTNVSAAPNGPLRDGHRCSHDRRKAQIARTGGTRQDERCRMMRTSAGRGVLLVQKTGVRAEDVPKRDGGGRSGKATAGESELE